MKHAMAIRFRSLLPSGATAILLATLSSGAFAADAPVTFYGDVLPILQQNCQTCHRPMGRNMGGMVAPMAFMSYPDVRPWAKAIARETEARRMPPWDAAPRFHGVFANERTLSDVDIATLVRWARTGAAAGNPADAPAPVEWPDHDWAFGTPDLVVEMPAPYFVDDEVEDIYVDFEVEITEEMLPEPRYLRASEARGGSQAVHHIIARPIGGLAPGDGAREYPDGYGSLLVPGTTVTFNMHYHKEPGPGTGVWDRSQVAVWFHDRPVTHEVRSVAVANGSFELPPGHPHWRVGASSILAEETIILSVRPHMHLRGKDARYTLFYPDGRQEVLLEVPGYDFNWQTQYVFAQPKRVPAGTRVEFVAHYDNSTANAYNPDPAAAVRYGRPTTAEMMIGFMTVARPAPASVPLEVPSGGAD